jgi:hypothetical protein
MRIIATILIALAIMGIAAATAGHVEIRSPHDGDRFSLGDTVKIKTMMSSTDGGQILGRMFINGEPATSSTWKPTEAGEYTITVEIADNKEFNNSIMDDVTITVLEPTS